MIQITYLISSCDAYPTVGVLFLHGIEKYWPDCQFDMAFVTILRSWAGNASQGLEVISFILYTREDVWIARPEVDMLMLENKYLPFTATFIPSLCSRRC